MLPIRTILYPTDFSARSEQAFSLACALARDYEARIILVHVKPRPIAMGEFGLLEPEAGISKGHLMEWSSQYRPADPNIVVEQILVEGDPAAEIVRLAKEKAADIIVMGTHGRNGLGRLLLGSVAEAVLRMAPCPVLTLKTPVIETSKVAEPAEEACPA